MILRHWTFLTDLLVILSWADCQNTLCPDCGFYGFCKPDDFNQTFATTTSANFIENNTTWSFTFPICSQCICPDSIEGSCCEELPNPCENKDICLNETDSDTENHLMCQQLDLFHFQCICEPGWTGQFCNETINFCEPDNNQCSVVGTQTCISFIDAYICACSSNFTGAYCETKMPEYCEPTECACNTNNPPCQNNGICFFNGPNEYYCECKAGFTGQNCETELPCIAANPCRHGGKCSAVSSNDTMGETNYVCDCLNIWMGQHCEDFNACSQEPCQNNATCWTTGNNQYKCDCSVGFTGLDCEVIIDLCEPNPCAYNASCVDNIEDYQCQCPPGTSGKNCENREFHLFIITFIYFLLGYADYRFSSYTYVKYLPFLWDPSITQYPNEGPEKRFYLQMNFDDSAHSIIRHSEPSPLGCLVIEERDNCMIDNKNSTTFIPFEDQPPNKCQTVDVNATCIDGFENYTCICSANYTGSKCDITLLMWTLLEAFPNPENPHLMQFVNMILANPTVIPEITPFFINNGSEGNSSDISWEIEDLFIWASFQGQELNLSSEITKTNHQTLGNCFTFNDISQPISYVTNGAGEDFGFQALMRVREDEYLPWTKLAALQVFIHARDEMVFSDSERYFAQPGAVSQFIISSTVYARLGGIYGACVDNTSDLQSNYYPGKYTNYGCVLSCYQNVVHLTCGCTDPRYLGINDPKIKVCPLSKGSCVLNVTATLGDPYTWTFCDCPVSCNDTQYSVLCYFSEFSLNPAECLTPSPGSSSQSCKEQVKDRAIISVFSNHNYHISFEETPSMNINEYISLFGGVTGIIAGFCIVSVVEFSFLVYRVLLTFCTNESVSLDEAGVQAEVDDEAYF